MIDTEKLKQSISLLDLIPSDQLHRVGHEWRGTCPIHCGKNKNAFAVYDNGQHWTCFSGDCGSGDVIAFVMAYKGVTFLEAVEYLGGGRTITPQEARQMAEARVASAKIELEAKQREYDEAVKDLSQTKLWERYHENLTNERRQYYRARGIPDSWQDIWKLGFNPSFTAKTSAGLLTTPALTLPIFSTGWQIKNIRNRLLNPLNPKDKYRPEREGLPTFPFMCDPDIGFNSDTIIVWEGEFKASVLYITLDDPKIQVLGLPGKNNWRGLVEQVKGHRLFIGFDPGAEKDACDFARAAGGAGVIALSHKVDDSIVENDLGKEWAVSLMKFARFVK